MAGSEYSAISALKDAFNAEIAKTAKMAETKQG